MTSGTRVELEIAGERYYAVMARTFADARPGDVILYEDSYKKMSLAISRGSARAHAARVARTDHPHHDPGLGERRAPLSPRARRLDLGGE